MPKRKKKTFLCCRTFRGLPGLVWLLFETPSGFAIFSYDGSYLGKENAVEVRFDHFPACLPHRSRSCIYEPLICFTYWVLVSPHLLQHIWARFIKDYMAQHASTTHYISLNAPCCLHFLLDMFSPAATVEIHCIMVKLSLSSICKCLYLIEVTMEK